MRDRKNISLAVCSALSLVLYCLSLSNLDVLDTTLWSSLVLSFHAVPAFCLQALLCRAAKWKWVKFIPPVLFSLAIFVGAMYLFGVWGSGWDALGGGLLLIWCVAPAAGCCLGWMTTDYKIGRCVAAVGWALLLGVYLGLKGLGGSWWHFESLDIPALLVLLAGLYLLFRRTDQKNDDE